MNPVSCTGVCKYESFTLEYDVVYLEYIHNSSIKIEAVCYNPYNEFDREATFKYSTNNLTGKDERLKISLLILNSLIKTLELSEDTLRKLVVNNKKAFYIQKV